MTIMVSGQQSEWSLSEAARLLGEPQHRLIYLCEKGVVQPDLQDADGRGSSRRFSARNLLEFGVALRLRELGIPASVIGAVLHVLRGFEKAIGSQLSGFKLPGSLTVAGAPELKVIIGDDQKLYFSLSAGKAKTKTYGGVSLQDWVGPADDPDQVKKSLRGVGKEVKQGELLAKVVVNVTGIAKDLGLNA
jgi:DNA-binding transcriptional MerR regulator